MARRSFDLGKKHDTLLIAMAKDIGISLVEVMRRSLELLELQRAQRDKEIIKK